jgi:hypothetical protein
VRQLELADIINRKHLHPFKLQVASFSGVLADAGAFINSHSWRMLKSPLTAAELLADADPAKVWMSCPFCAIQCKLVATTSVFGLSCAAKQLA